MSFWRNLVRKISSKWQPSLTAPKVVILTVFRTASDENLVKITIFPFQSVCMQNGHFRQWIGRSPKEQNFPHDDVIKWKHFPRYWSFVWGIHRSPVNSPHKGPVTQSFDVIFDLRLNKRLSKPLRRRWFETPPRSLWRHCNLIHVFNLCVNECIWRDIKKKPYFHLMSFLNTGMAQVVDTLSRGRQGFICHA